MATTSTTFVRRGFERAASDSPGARRAETAVAATPATTRQLGPKMPSPRANERTESRIGFGNRGCQYRAKNDGTFRSIGLDDASDQTRRGSPMKNEDHKP